MNEQPTDQPTEQPGDRPTEQPMLESVEAVAARLGISRNAVLQRIKRGTIAGEKVDGVWWIVTTDRPTDRPTSRPADRPSNRPTDQPTTVAVNTAARSQLEAIRDEWLAPLVAQITEQAETIGRLTAEREQLQRERDAAEQRAVDAQAERDELRALQRLQHAAQDTQVHPVIETPQEQPQRAWWQVWRR